MAKWSQDCPRLGARRLLVALTAVLAFPIAGQSHGKAAISVTCQPAAGVSESNARQLCREAVSLLQQADQTRGFHFDKSTPPHIILAVSQANERGVGLQADWIAADGVKTSSARLHVSFFDQASNSKLRRRFLDAFFKQNPLPF